jgi:hypothetical protein
MIKLKKVNIHTAFRKVPDFRTECFTTVLLLIVTTQQIDRFYCYIVFKDKVRLMEEGSFPICYITSK